MPAITRADHRARLRISPSVRSTAAGEDLVLLHLERGTYFTLNETGAWIWQQIGAGRTVSEIWSSLPERFAVDEEKAKSDVLALLGDLLAEELVAAESDETPAAG